MPTIQITSQAELDALPDSFSVFTEIHIVSAPGVEITVSPSDVYLRPNARHPHKIAFRAGEVLYECDVMGKKIQ